MSDFFTQNISTYPAKFQNDLFLLLHKQPFITAYFKSSLHIFASLHVKTSLGLHNLDYQWEEQTTRERTGHLLISKVEAKHDG